MQVSNKQAAVQACSQQARGKLRGTLVGVKACSPEPRSALPPPSVLTPTAFSTAPSPSAQPCTAPSLFNHPKPHPPPPLPLSLTRTKFSTVQIMMGTHSRVRPSAIQMVQWNLSACTHKHTKRHQGHTCAKQSKAMLWASPKITPSACKPFTCTACPQLLAYVGGLETDSNLHLVTYPIAA